MFSSLEGFDCFYLMVGGGEYQKIIYVQRKAKCHLHMLLSNEPSDFLWQIVEILLTEFVILITFCADDVLPSLQNLSRLFIGKGKRTKHPTLNLVSQYNSFISKVFYFAK
jgi:hypothetical protein